MTGLVKVTTNELLATSTPYPCTWIGWYYNGSFREQLLHIYYACEIRQPSTVKWNMTLRHLCLLPQVKKVEIFPLEVDSSTLLHVFRDTITGEEVKEYSGWDLVQAQLDEISVQETKVYILKNLVWQNYYTNDELNLTVDENILRRYIPNQEDVMSLRSLIEESDNVSLAEAFNRCFPYHELLSIDPGINEYSATTKEELLPFRASVSF